MKTDPQRQADDGQAHPHEASDKYHDNPLTVTKATAPTATIDMLAEAARLLHLGIAVIPPKPDASKAPLVSWREYPNHLPTEVVLQKWYANGNTGLGVVCGKVSGNLECLDFDCRDVWQHYQEAAQSVDLGDLLVRVIQGYSEHTPNGFHLFYRVSGKVGASDQLAIGGGGIERSGLGAGCTRHEQRLDYA